MCSGFGAAASRRLLARDRHACSDVCCPEGRAGRRWYCSSHSHTCVCVAPKAHLCPPRAQLRKSKGSRARMALLAPAMTDDTGGRCQVIAQQSPAASGESA